MMSILVAWRNLWRNRRRTLITASAAALSTAILIFFFSLIDGMLIQFVGDVTQVYVGEAQIHAQGYMEDRSLYKTIPHPGPFLAVAKKMKIAAVPRAYGFGLVSSGAKSAGASFWGMDPAAERAAFGLAGKMEHDGSQFLPDKPQKGIVLGKKLAHTLNAHIGSEIIVVVQAADGSLGNDIFHVTGILQGTTENIDRSGVLLHIRDFEQLFAAQGMVHEIALNSRNAMDSTRLASLFAGLDPATETRTWQKIMPFVADMLNGVKVSMFIMDLIFCLAAGLGVTNTMLMATHERIREFGVLKALGSSPWRITRDIVIESSLLGAVACLAGLIAGVAVTLAFQKNGIDLSGLTGGNVSMGGLSVEFIMRPALGVKAVVTSVMLMWLTCVVASLYPAVKAARLDPIQALTHI